MKKVTAPDLQQRLVEFLNSSTKLATQKDINYALEKLQQIDSGFYGAGLDAFLKGRDHSPISPDDILKWHYWITSESNSKVGLFSKNSALLVLSEFLDDLHAELSSLTYTRSELQVIEILATKFLTFYGLHVFGRDDLQLALLLLLYMTTWCKIPFFVIKEQEKAEFRQALQSPITLRHFFAKKRREAIYGPDGSLMKAISEDPLNNTYQNEQGKSITIQWDEYVLGAQAWK